LIPVNAGGAFGNGVRMEIYCRDNFYLKLGNVFNIMVFTMTCPFFDKQVKKLLNLVGTTNIYTRPYTSIPLLGLNVILKLKTIIEPFSNDLAILTFSSPNIDNYKKNSFPTLISSTLQNVYELIILGNNLKLYLTTSWQIVNGDTNPSFEVYDLNHIFFGITKSYLKYQGSNNKDIYRSYTIKSPLILIVFSDFSYEKHKKMKDQINLNPNIDGFIIRQLTSPNCFEIWIKNLEKITLNKEILFEELLSYEDYNLDNDIKIILDNKLCSFYIDEFFNKIE